MPSPIFTETLSLTESPEIPFPLISEVLNKSEKELVQSLGEDEDDPSKLKKGRPIKCKTCKSSFKLTESEKKDWINKGYICPICNIELCYLPPTERELKYLQDEYLLERKEKTMEKMYTILASYARSLILRKHYQYFSKPEELEYFAHSAAAHLLDHYLKRPGFKIESSFGSYLRFTIMYTISDVEQAFAPFSLDYSDPETKRVFEMPSKVDVIGDIEDRKDKINLISYVTEFLFSISQFANSSSEEFNRLIALKLFLHKGERSADLFFQKTDRLGKSLYEKSLEILKRELIKLSSGT